MGQTESRNSTSRSNTNSGDYRNGEGPRYEMKKDTYEFWNTVDKRVPNALGSRLSDYEIRPSTPSHSYRQYEPTEAVGLYGSRPTLYASGPISTMVVQEPSYHYPTAQPVIQQRYSTAVPIVQSSGSYASYQPYHGTPAYTTVAPYTATASPGW
jgi:hypothetical protein